MPKLRLNQVLADKQIEVDKLSEDVQNAIASLRNQNTNPNETKGDIIIAKIDDQISKEVKEIAEALNISIFDLFVPSEKFYRLKIIERLQSLNYSGTPEEQLGTLYTRLKETSQISFALLIAYATQVFPDNLIKEVELKRICEILEISLEELKDVFNLNRKTISVESILVRLGITLDDLELLMDIPKRFIPWLSSDPIVIKISDDLHTRNLMLDSLIAEERADRFIEIDPCKLTIFCLISDSCPKPCR